MYKGEPIEGIGFFKLLYEDDDFCKELGKAVLAAGRLEAKLACYLNSKGIQDAKIKSKFRSPY